jgi:hypothetical protein
MNALPLATSIALLMATTVPGIAADEPQLQRLATCKDSWFVWKNDEARTASYVDFIKPRFVPTEQRGAFTPKAPTTVFGLQVTQVFPGTVGMAVGFSMVVNADFAKARKIFEKQLGHSMKCESGDGMKTCEFQIEDKRTAILMAEDNGNAKTSLIGCYYFYEK